MRWFGRKSADVPPLFLSYPGPSERNLFPSGYQAQLKEVFLGNPVGQRAVRMVAGAVGALKVYALEGDNAAASLIGRASLLEQVAASLLLHGNAYLQLVEALGAPAELFLLQPDRVTVDTDERGWPRGYTYRAGRRSVRINRHDALERVQLIHIKSLNPVQDQSGLGCLEAACAAASIHNRASRWNKALLDNAARPSGALTYDPPDGAPLSASQFERLREEIEKQFSGSLNAGRPMLLEGGLRWQSLGLSPTDMDFVAVKEAAARDIALAFGVPPVLLGLPGDTAYSNLREAGRALYRQTVLPLAERIIGEMSEALRDWIGPVKLAIDTDAISELAEDRERLWQMVAQADFISSEEKREMLGFERKRQQH
ncbi:HK97 family phage portal protein [Sphingomonas kaistensis]|uniref:HK97 family phage portal protein n=1 Tax=Sphingomonas kaistensis TaxID=298708 RepID=A0A7X5Y869_9SPHN|nr:phage portal protein [Sphingomonas kaistensis]NJC06942.1 HK97 family phage portal protein [Sphingomonas kaistensis]